MATAVSHDELQALRHIAYVARSLTQHSADLMDLRAALDTLDAVRKQQSKVAFVRSRMEAARAKRPG